MATKVRLASQHVVVAHDHSGSYHSVYAKLSLPSLGIRAVMVGHHLSSPPPAATWAAGMSCETYGVGRVRSSQDGAKEATVL